MCIDVCQEDAMSIEKKRDENVPRGRVQEMHTYRIEHTHEEDPGRGL